MSDQGQQFGVLHLDEPPQPEEAPLTTVFLIRVGFNFNFF